MRNNVVLYFLLLLLPCCHPNPQEPAEKERDLFEIGTKEKIYSKILDEEREVYIHVPSGFYGMNETNMSYPVLIVMDGENLFLPTVGIMNQLSSPFSANDQCPPMIVVGIPNTNRDRDLSPTKAIIGKDSSTLENTGGASKMAEFIGKELLPYIDQNYNTTTNRTLVGHSLGGLFAIHTLLNYPHLFSNYLSIDPGMSWDKGRYRAQVLANLEQEQFDGQTLFIAIANTKMPWMTREDLEKDTTEVLRITRSLFKFQKEVQPIELQGLHLEFQFYEQDNHFTVSMPAIIDGLKYFYRHYHFPKMLAYYAPDSNFTSREIVQDIEDHYRNISTELGYKALPMENYIQAWAFSFAHFGKPETATALFDLNIRNYPESAMVYASKGNFLLSQKDTLAAISNFEKSLELGEDDFIRERLDLLLQQKD